MFDADFNFINEEFYAYGITLTQLDSLLAGGWRHFGAHFFRYNVGIYEFDIRYVIPLRIRLAGSSFSRSQRRTISRNRDLDIVFGPLNITAESQRLFDRHKSRFKNHVPDSIHDFVSASGIHSFETKQLSVRKGSELIAESYFDVGGSSLSGVYGTFDPRYSNRRLGIFTLLKEIEYALDERKDFYYLGYSYAGRSFYDYKKKFRSSEYFDWKRNRWEVFNFDEESNADSILL